MQAFFVGHDRLPRTPVAVDVALVKQVRRGALHLRAGGRTGGEKGEEGKGKEGEGEERVIIRCPSTCHFFLEGEGVSRRKKMMQSD